MRTAKKQAYIIVTYTYEIVYALQKGHIFHMIKTLKIAISQRYCILNKRKYIINYTFHEYCKAT